MPPVHLKYFAHYKAKTGYVKIPSFYVFYNVNFVVFFVFYSIWHYKLFFCLYLLRTEDTVSRITESRTNVCVFI